MKISITGSREIKDYIWFSSKLDEVLSNFDKSDITFISGGAIGIDSLIKQYCINNNFSLEEIIPNWKKFGKSAGILRNKIIIDSSDYNLIFWDGKSKGSKFNIDYCKKNKKNFKVMMYGKL